MKKVWNNFILGFVNGIAILTPVIITVLIIRFLVMKLNDMLFNPLLKLLNPLQLAGYEVPLAKTIILFLAILAVGLVGWGGKVWVIHRAFSLGERIFIRVPVLGRIYKAVKQIISSFVGQGKTLFRKAVLVEFPRKGVYSIGFVTGSPEGEIKARTFEDGIHVFVPTAPNPTSGFFMIVPKSELIYLEMSVENALKLVISGGVMSSSHYSSGKSIGS